MANVGPDRSAANIQDSSFYWKQRPAIVVNGSTPNTEVVLDQNSLLSLYGQIDIGGVVLPSRVQFTITPAAANKSRVTMTVRDGAGYVLTGQPWRLDFSLSDATNGVGLTATTPSGGIAVITGTLITTYVASKAIYAESDNTGTLVVEITDTAKTGFYAVAIGPGPLPGVSVQMTAANYG